MLKCFFVILLEIHVLRSEKKKITLKFYTLLLHFFSYWIVSGQWYEDTYTDIWDD